VKKFIKKLRPKIVIAKLRRPKILVAVAVVALLIVVGVVVFSGGDSKDETAAGVPKPVLTPNDIKAGKFKGRKVKQAPRVRTGVVDEARREGRLVQAQARGTIVKPGRISLRVSAAPKQKVSVNWQLGCYRNRRAKIGRGEYRVRTPNIRRIPVSIAGAESCIVTATAGLTKVDGKGRVKVSVVAG
jgi:hypothetical protein